MKLTLELMDAFVCCRYKAFLNCTGATGRIKTSRQRAKFEQPGLLGLIIVRIPTIGKRLCRDHCLHWASFSTVS
jgi:hypothetical protein